MPLALRSNCFPSHSEDQHAEEEEEDDDTEDDENNPRYHRRKHDANTTPKRNANANPRDDGDEDASLRLLFIFICGRIQKSAIKKERSAGVRRGANASARVRARVACTYTRIARAR